MTPSEFEILGAGFDGGGPERGPAAAPTALRERRLLPRLERLVEIGVVVTDGGDVTATPSGDEGESRPRNLRELLHFSRDLMSRLEEVFAAGRIPILLGGDHAVSIPSVSAAARHLRSTRGADARLGLVYVDAHADLETPEGRPGADLHGMTVATLLGRGPDELADLGVFRPKLRPEDVVILGLRDTVACERELIRDLGIFTITSIDLERSGIEKATRRAIERACVNTDGFVLSFDLDALDPLAAPGVHYREPGGLTVREAALLMEEIGRTPGLMMIEMVELVPERDRDHVTADLAVQLLWHAVGGRFVPS